MKRITEWLAPLGLYLTAKTNDEGKYLVTMVRILPALEGDVGENVLSHDDFDMYRPAKAESGIKRVVNQINAQVGWDIVKEAHDEKMKVIATDDDSLIDFGRRREITWKFPGFRWSIGTAIQYVTNMASKAFRRFGRPYDVLKLNVSRAKGWNIQSGDTVQISLPNYPTREGTRGFSYRNAVVLRANHSYWKPGDSVGSEITVAVEDQYRATTYCPSAAISNVAGTTITLSDADAYTKDSDKEIHHFSDGMIVYIYNEGDYGSGVDKRTLSNKNEGAGTFTISSGLSITPGARTIMIFAGHDDGATTEQKSHAYIGSSATPSELSGSTESFKYA
jgi:hypothetical protein